VMHLSWDYDWLADSYTIERRTWGSSYFTALATIDATDPASYDDISAVIGTHYEYRIIAKKITSTNQLLMTDSVIMEFDAQPGLIIPEFTLFPLAKQIQVIGEIDYNRLIRIDVLTSTTENGTYTVAGSIGGTDTFLPIGATLVNAIWDQSTYVKVRGVYSFQYQLYYSSLSKAQSAVPNLNVNNLAVWTSGIMNTVYWDDNGADAYAVYYSADGIDYTMIATPTSAQYDHWGLKLDQTGYYKVQAYMTVNNVFISGPISDPLYFVVRPPYQFVAAEFKDRTSVDLVWDDLDTFQVDGYILSRSSDNVHYTVIGEYDRSIQKVSLTGIDPKILYTYRLQAFVDIHGVRYTSQFQEDPIVPIVKGTKMTRDVFSPIGYSLRWDAVSGASGYLVYRADQDLYFSYKQIADVSTTSYIDPNSYSLPFVNFYYYMVVPYFDYNGVRVYGAGARYYYQEMDPQITITADVGYNNVVLTIGNQGVAGYELYRASSYYGARTTLQSGLFSGKQEITYTNTGLPINAQYYYFVKGYYYLNGVKTYASEQLVIARTKLKAPELTIKTVSPTSLGLSWKAIPGATSYSVYWSSEYSQKFIATVTSTSYTVTGLTPENEYQYYVVANATVNSVVYKSDPSAAVSEYATLPAVTGLKATGFFNDLVISWNAVPGVAGYYLFASNTETGDITSLDVGKVTIYSVYSLDPNTLYEVYLWPYYYVNGQLNFGYLSDAVKVSTKFDTPVVTSRALSQTSVQLDWYQINGSTSYSVYIKNLKTGYFEFLLETTDVTATVTGLPIGIPQTFRVRANRETNLGQLISPYGTTTVTPALSAPINIHKLEYSYNSLKFAFTGNLDATGYEIYQSTSATGTYAKIATITSTQYLSSGLTFNTSYFYKIRAYLTYAGGTTYSPYSAIYTAKTALTYPLNVKVASISYNSIKVSWDAVAGANGYEVFRATNYGTFGLVTTTTALTFTNTGLLTGSSYTYKIRPYRLVGLTKIYSSEFSDMITDSAKPNVPLITVQSVGYDSVRVSWPAVAGATEYTVEYTTDNFSSNILSTQTVKTNYVVITGLKTNVPLYVRAFATYVNGTLHCASYTTAVSSATPLPSTPALKVVVSGFDAVALSWNAISGADGYELYVKSGAGDYALLNDAASITFNHIGLTSGVTYTYKIKAYRTIDSVRIYSADAIVSAIPVPSTVTGLKIVTPKYTELSLNWSAVTGATGYEITRSATLTGVYAFVANVEGSLAYINTGLAFNTSYFYKVRSYTTINTVKVYGIATIAVTGKTTLETVLNPAAAYTSYNTNAISWSAVNGATGYEIYRSTGTSTYYGLLTSVTGTSYNNTSLYTNTRYNYKIRAYRLIGTVRIYGAFSSIVSATPLPWAPVATVVSSGYNSLKVTWAAVTGANGYEVSYATSETGTYTKLATVTVTSATIANLLTNTTYYVKVRAYRIVNYVKIYGALSVVKTGTPIPNAPVVTAVSAGFGSVKVSWLAIPGASGYEVYLQSPESPDYFLAAETATLTATVERLMTGTSYNVKVKAYRLVNSVRIYSIDSAVKSATPVPAVVGSFKVAMPSVTSLKLSWASVPGATGYELFKATTSTGTYVSLGATETGTEFTVTGLTFNTSTYYKIRAYTTVGGVKIFGSTTATITRKTMPSTVVLSVAGTSYTSNQLSWPAIEGATGYEIYYSAGTSTYYTLLKTLTTTYFAHTGLVFNTQYNYKVRAYKLVGTVKYYGAYSTLISIKTAVLAPSAISNSTHDSISLSWNTVTGATGYEVSIATALSGPYTVITQTAISKTYSALNTGTTYYIKLRSYRLVSTTKVYGPYSSVITVTPKLEIPSLQLTELTSTTATLSWAAVAGATDYEVRIISDAIGAEWVTESVSELTVTFSDLDPLAHYTVKIRAVKKIGEVSVYSEYSLDVLFCYGETA